MLFFHPFYNPFFMSGNIKVCFWTGHAYLATTQTADQLLSLWSDSLTFGCDDILLLFFNKGNRFFVLGPAATAEQQTQQK